MSISEEASGFSRRPAAHQTSISAGAKTLLQLRSLSRQTQVPQSWWLEPGLGLALMRWRTHTHTQAHVCTRTQILVVVTWLSRCSIAVLHSATCCLLRRVPSARLITPSQTLDVSHQLGLIAPLFNCLRRYRMIMPNSSALNTWLQ